LLDDYAASFRKMSSETQVRLLTEERRREIVNLLEKEGRVTVSELKKLFGISAVTARSDLDALNRNGLLVRSHGGGIRPLVTGPDFPLKVRETLYHEEKQRIARAALELIRPHQTVIIGSGTTCGGLARQIRRAPPEHLTVITYALNVAAQLSEMPNLALVVIGGIFRQVSNALVGPQAEQMMASFQADHCFLGTVGLDAEVGLTTLDILEAQLNAKMLNSARESTVLADSTKFGHRSLAVIADSSQIQRVITDSNAPRAGIDDFRARGVEVLTV
jgi:DeoR family transcriptional regulator, aga operon transcriptional repressor